MISMKDKAALKCLQFNIDIIDASIENPENETLAEHAIFASRTLLEYYRSQPKHEDEGKPVEEITLEDKEDADGD